MPITAKLSRKFYETLGDEVTNELVTWLNAVDTSYREEFRELFAANFGRLEAELRAFESRMEGELRALRAEFDAKLDALRAEFDIKLQALEHRMSARLDKFEARMLRWMLVFWAGTVGTVLALLKL